MHRWRSKIPKKGHFLIFTGVKNPPKNENLQNLFPTTFFKYSRDGSCQFLGQYDHFPETRQRKRAIFRCKKSPYKI